MVLGEIERVVRIDLVDGKLVDLVNAVLLDDELGRREIVETELRLDTEERDDEDETKREGVRAREDDTLEMEGARREEDEEEIFLDRDFELPCESLTEMSTNAQLKQTTKDNRVTLENLHFFCIVPTGATDQLALNGL